jgi:hypothetical protein
VLFKIPHSTATILRREKGAREGTRELLREMQLKYLLFKKLIDASLLLFQLEFKEEQTISVDNVFIVFIEIVIKLIILQCSTNYR